MSPAATTPESTNPATPKPLSKLLAEATAIGEQSVPTALFGCWRRNWIQFGEGNPKEADVQVLWLQTVSGTGDLRVSPLQTPIESDSSCGITVVDQATKPYMTADWHDGASGFSQQPVSRFPEKGWLVWDSPSVMRELAPSGAYVEEWERLPDSVGPVAHLIAPAASTTTNLYIAGGYGFLAVRSNTTGGLHDFACGRFDAVTGSLHVELASSPDHADGTRALGDQAWQIVSYQNA